MRVIAKSTLRKFWELPQHGDARGPLESWHDEACHAAWTSPQDIKDQYRHASICGNNRVVFNIAGNKYRLVLHFDYRRRTGFIRFIGTHAQYDAIDAETI